MKNCFLVHLPLPEEVANRTEGSLTLAFTNFPDKSDVIKALESKEIESGLWLRNLVKKSTWPTNRLGRRVFGEIMIETVPVTNNDKRGT